MHKNLIIIIKIIIHLKYQNSNLKCILLHHHFAKFCSMPSSFNKIIHFSWTKICSLKNVNAIYKVKDIINNNKN